MVADSVSSSPEPLAVRLRPSTLDECIGQAHLLGIGKPLRLVVERKRLFSMIFWGPPGVGKTTLARILAKNIENVEFVEMSAVSAGKADIRAIVEKKVVLLPELVAGEQADLAQNKKQVVLFLDEIHRFTKAQQDFLLPYVETGALTLIGATTENPSFSVISPLLSRCRVFVLQPLTDSEIGEVIDRALKELKVKGIERDAKEWLVACVTGDARQALTILDNLSLLQPVKNQKITKEMLQNAVQVRTVLYDKKGEEHYNTISAFIKSLRAGQVDAALYYLARMVEAGEDPLFIARRMVIFASEDVGVGQPTALVVANAVFAACQSIGYPECQINLAHGVVYLANCKKNRSAYDAYFAAQADVKQFGALSIPLAVRNAPTKLMKGLGYGKGYAMYTKESFLPKELQKKKYWEEGEK